MCQVKLGTWERWKSDDEWHNDETLTPRVYMCYILLPRGTGFTAWHHFFFFRTGDLTEVGTTTVSLPSK